MPNLALRVGADPEFTVLYGGQRMAADKVITSLFNKDSRLSGHTLKTPGGEFGCDGCSATGELRPKPDFDPKKVADNIYTCISAFMERGKNFELSTLSLWAPIGGHIHLELPEGASEAKVKTWHRKLMSLYLPIILGEQKVNLALRMGSGHSYGQMDDYRTGDGKPTCEVRTPSAEWLTSRRITEATLAYMGVAWEEITKNPKAVPDKLLLKTQKQLNAMQELAISEFEAINKAMLKEIASTVRKFKSYANFKNEIELILNPEQVLKEKRAINFSINKGWDFEKETQIKTKRDLLKKVKEIPDTDNLFLGVAHNDDINTGFFADELKKRIAKGLPLKNNYFIFGLKKEITGALVAKNNTFFITPKINTKNDIDTIQTTRQKMIEKAKMFSKEERSIDWEKKTIVEKKKDAVVIGLPFDVRSEKRLKDFLQIVWDIEQENLKEITLSLPDPKEQTEDAIRPSAPSVDPSELGDVESHGAQLALRAIRALRQERNQALNIENREGLLEDFVNFVRNATPVSWRCGNETGFGVVIGTRARDFLVIRSDQEGWEYGTDRADIDLVSDVPVPLGTRYCYYVDSVSPVPRGERTVNLRLNIRDRDNSGFSVDQVFTLNRPTTISITENSGTTTSTHINSNLMASFL